MSASQKLLVFLVIFFICFPQTQSRKEEGESGNALEEVDILFSLLSSFQEERKRGTTLEVRILIPMTDSDLDEIARRIEAGSQALF